jgi:hypothetical protein
MSTQCEEILTYLEHHGSITPLEALQELGCFRLAARIHDIEQKGYTVPRKTVEVIGRVNGRKCHVTEYSRPIGQRNLF